MCSEASINPASARQINLCRSCTYSVDPLVFRGFKGFRAWSLGFRVEGLGFRISVFLAGF